MGEYTENKDGTRDFPFDLMCAQAKELSDQGIRVYQKFTCVGCGNRLTIEEPNHFYEEGTCDNCSAVTNIRERGCNYLVHMVFGMGEQMDPAEMQRKADEMLREAKERMVNEGGRNDVER